MRPFRTYLKGNTIIEVLIALAITSFCGALAVLIYLNLQRSSLPFLKLKATELMEAYMKETLEKRDFYEDSYSSGSFTIKRTLVPHDAFGDCYVIRLVAFDSEKERIADLETVVYPGN